MSWWSPLVLWFPSPSVPVPTFDDCTECASYCWYHRHVDFPLFFQFPYKVWVLISLFAFLQFYFVVCWNSKVPHSAGSLFLFFYFDYHSVWSSSRDQMIRLYLKIPQKLWVSFSRTDYGLCIYLLLVWWYLNFLHNWITLPTQSSLRVFHCSSRKWGGVGAFTRVWGTANFLGSPISSEYSTQSWQSCGWSRFFLEFPSSPMSSPSLWRPPQAHQLQLGSLSHTFYAFFFFFIYSIYSFIYFWGGLSQYPRIYLSIRFLWFLFCGPPKRQNPLNKSFLYFLIFSNFIYLFIYFFYSLARSKHLSICYIAMNNYTYSYADACRIVTTQ